MNKPNDIKNTLLFQAIMRSIDLLVPKVNRSSISIVDLGCRDGAYALGFAELGFVVTGIEARNTHIDVCNRIKEQSGLSNLTFVHDDVKNMDNYPPFDVVFCSGLLYHLDQPVSFLHQLGKQAKKMLIVNSHYALSEDTFYDSFLHKWIRRIMRKLGLERLDEYSRTDYGLSKLCLNEGHEGRWYPEYAKNASEEKIEKSLLAAYSNYKSFWLTKYALLNVMREAGFEQVYEQYDHLHDIERQPFLHKAHRGLFIGIKP